MNEANRFINCREKFHAGKGRSKRMNGRGRYEEGKEGMWGKLKGRTSETHEEFYLVECKPTFQRNMSPKFSGLKNKPSKKSS
jgi:RecB family exonuclease